MEEARSESLKVDMRVTNGSWHVVVEQEGQTRVLGGLGELIRYLQSLAAAGDTKPARGLR